MTKEFWQKSTVVGESTDHLEGPETPSSCQDPSQAVILVDVDVATFFSRHIFLLQHEGARWRLLTQGLTIRQDLCAWGPWGSANGGVSLPVLIYVQATVLSKRYHVALAYGKHTIGPKAAYYALLWDWGLNFCSPLPRPPKRLRLHAFVTSFAVLCWFMKKFNSELNFTFSALGQFK